MTDDDEEHGANSASTVPPPKGETSFIAVDGGFTYANELVAFIRQRHGVSLSVGGAAYPEKHVECASPEVDLDNLLQGNPAVPGDGFG